MRPKNKHQFTAAHHYRTIVRSLPVGFSVIDHTGVIVEFNPAAEQITGYSAKEIIGRSHLDVLHGSSDPAVCPFINHIFTSREQSVEIEGEFKRKDGQLRTASITCAPLFGRSGDLRGGVEIFRDITDLKRLERERKNILSMLAHDMKNPLLVAHGFVSRLSAGKAGHLTSKEEDYLRAALESIERVERLVSEFTDFSRFEHEQLLRFSSIDLAILMEEQIKQLGIEAERKGIGLFLEYPDIIPEIRADRSAIERVVANLIDNAIKYTNPGGSVRVKLIVLDGSIVVEVIDTGVGIRKEDLPHVFDIFYRANNDSQGTGLGLAVARKIVDDHGGDIRVESTVGGGSTFRFSLPIR